jgi:hypothetical protein
MSQNEMRVKAGKVFSLQTRSVQVNRQIEVQDIEWIWI